MLKKILFTACLSFVFFIFACKNNENKPEANVHDTIASARDSSHHTIYACPMDTDVTSEEFGQCPKCGMDLEIKNQ
jgi:hypothetical protein